jgi:hypothetical protein
LLQLAEVTIDKVSHCATPGANEVMVVFLRPPQQITAAIAAGVHLTEESELVKYIKSTVYSYQPNARVLLTNLIVYIGWSKMVMAEGDCIQHRAPLRGELIALLSEDGCYFLLCKYHLVAK